MKRTLLIMLVLAGCGDPRADFVGIWTGQGQVDVTTGGKTTTTQKTEMFRIVLSTNAQDMYVLDAFACDHTARIVSDTSFTIDGPMNCPAQQSDGCTITMKFNQGTGTRTGTSLSINYNGTFDGQCMSGGPMSGTFTERFDGAPLPAPAH